MQRREFIIGASAITLCAAAGIRFASSFKKENKKSFLEGGFFRVTEVYGHEKYTPYQNFANSSVFRWNPLDQSFLEVACQTPAHDVEPLLDGTHRSLAISKLSNVISLIDWDQKAETAFLTLPDKEFFFGHGFVDSKSGVAFVGGGDMKGVGSLHVVDLKSFKILDSLHINQRVPHEMYRLSENEYLMGAVNTKASIRAGLILANVANGKMEYVPINFNDPHAKIIGHFVDVSSTQMVWSANTKHIGFSHLNLIFFNKKTFQSEVYDFKDEYAFSTISSISFNPLTNELWITFPSLKRVISFDIHEKKIKQQVQLETNPRGVAVDVNAQKIYTTARAEIYNLGTSQPALVNKVADRFSDHCSWS